MNRAEIEEKVKNFLIEELEIERELHIKNNTNRRDKRPVLSDFQDDSLYRFCDIVQFVYQDEEHNFYNPDHKKAEIITVKNYMNGRTGTVSVTAPDVLPDMVEIIE